MFLQDYPHKTTPGTQAPPTACRADPELICASSHLGIWIQTPSIEIQRGSDLRVWFCTTFNPNNFDQIRGSATELCSFK